MSAPELSWLPSRPDWSDALRSIGNTPGPKEWSALVSLANVRLDFVSTLRLDRRLVKLFGDAPPTGLATRSLRLAVLGSSTVDHLFSAIRVGALRRGLWTSLYKTDYGQYSQELFDKNSELRRWKPETVLFSLDARHLLGGFGVNEPADEVNARLDRQIEILVNCWRVAREQLGCRVIQQTALPIFPALLGNNEHRLAGSPARLVGQLNSRLREHADAEGVDILAVDDKVAADGLNAWHDPMLWHRAKQEIHPAASPVYGDLVGRILAAQQGLSSKCIVLDLDNTLWGGVIGDDGLNGIILGQGSSLGEAFVMFQKYVKDLSTRGVILAVCSKNDEANALEPFEKHPEMVLRRSDIACFSASWQDKASAIRDIAKQLNIGIDSLVFVDDNPFERNIVRRELPMVAVPEMPQDPSLYPATISAAGYFESVGLTSEDLARTQQYQANSLREALKVSASDVDGYLKSLGMEMRWSRFQQIDSQRIVQLINKTNQFNLTTRRYSEEEVSAVIAAPGILSLQIRLVDQFGDNGIIALVIGRVVDDTTAIEIDTWLMSCRVLGRQVEQATLNLVVEEAKRLGADRLIGRYRPTAKNRMVENHYPNLGFSPCTVSDGDGQCWELTLAERAPSSTFIKIIEA
ncbi:HAD-IIIC family phosphatase [Telmatospirillum sp.]|uniref:HAD-IIIC family phosphatase n=1 Tax=Telmatospirillum sp. TaxID=2079197 RepID=UPI002850887B|nr:HAD-IIIC family phosphatase [Telmatospirillum sp.]MDR3439933.1 HAD-IIIC family phosphatase [Telmatospirillum sp.]